MLQRNTPPCRPCAKQTVKALHNNVCPQQNAWKEVDLFAPLQTQSETNSIFHDFYLRESTFNTFALIRFGDGWVLPAGTIRCANLWRACRRGRCGCLGSLIRPGEEMQCPAMPWRVYCRQTETSNRHVYENYTCKWCPGTASWRARDTISYFGLEEIQKMHAYIKFLYKNSLCS